MAFRSHLHHALVAAGLLLVVAACVDSPAGRAPDARAGAPSLGRVKTTDDAQLLVPATFEPIARYLDRPHAQDYWIKQWVGPAGGTVNFLGFRIVVPPGAVDRVTKFEIRIPGANDPSGQEFVWAEFGPHNVNFKVPVRLEIPYRNTDAYGVSTGISWYNSRARQWVQMGGQVTPDGERVYLDVTHFSDWGKDGGPTGTGSGGRISY